MLGEISVTKSRSELVKFHNASVRHIKPSPPAGDFFGAFSGPGWGRGGFSPLLPGRTLPSFQMKRSRKRRKRRHRCCCGQWNLFPIFWRPFFFGVWGGNFGGVSCWRLGIVLWVVVKPCGGMTWPVKTPSFFFWCRNAAGWSQVDEDELEMGERELYEVQLTDKSLPWAIPAPRNASCHDVRNA